MSSRWINCTCPGALHGSHPPEGLERSLHRDANRLAGLWGLMTYERTPAIAVNQIEPVVLEVYRRWMDSATVKS